MILARTKTGATGQQYSAMLVPKIPANQRRAVKVFALDRVEAVFFQYYDEYVLLFKKCIVCRFETLFCESRASRLVTGR